MEMPIEIFKSEDGKIQVNVRIEGETAWLTQAAMAQLFGCTTENVLMHLKNIYADGELQDSATTKDFLVVRQEGTRQVTRQIKHYNLDAIIAVGYRVNSARATQFRICGIRGTDPNGGVRVVELKLARSVRHLAPVFCWQNAQNRRGGLSGGRGYGRIAA